MSDKKLNKIKSGFWDRSLSMTKLALKSSASLAAHSLKHALSDEQVRADGFKALLEGQAKRLALELGQLKGSVMKVGQMLALYGEHFFPEEVVRALQSLNEQSPPLSWDAIQPILKKRLSPEQLSQLEVEEDALAAASMGQVHRARLKYSQELICLKLQYPGVAQAIDSDVKTLRSLLGMFKLIPANSQRFESLFKEINSMLKKETDYGMELKATDMMAEFLADRPMFLLPKTYPEFSGPKILATSYEKGIAVDSPEVKALPQNRRNQLGEWFALLFLEELFVFHHMQTDPHFGNYKIRLSPDGDDKIILLDFGAIRRFPKKFVKHYRNLLRGALLHDRDLMIEGATAVGFLRPDDGKNLQDCFVDLANLAIEPWLPPHDPRCNHQLLDENNCYLWSKSELPSKITKKAAEYALTFKMRPPPREVIFLDRKIGGVFIVLKTLDARFNSWELIKHYM